jgi:hypothetical protein
MYTDPVSTSSAKDNSVINLDELLRDHEAAQAQARLAKRQQIMQPKAKQPPLRATKRGAFVSGLAIGIFLPSTLGAILDLLVLIQAASR